MEHRRRRRRSAGRVRRPGVLSELVQAQSEDSDQRRLSAAHHRRRAFLGARACERLVLHHRHLAIVHPRADPAPALLLLAALAALRPGERIADRRAAGHGRRRRNCSSILAEAADASRATYAELLGRLEAKFADQPNAVLRRKQARQAARAVLPNATETRIVVTGNYRAWRHFIAMRASEHADVGNSAAGDRVSARNSSMPRLRFSATSRSPHWPTAPRSRPVRWPPRLDNGFRRNDRSPLRSACPNHHTTVC